jgi:hypothetical protein
VTDAERIERIARLEGAIRRHRDYRGDDRCHLDDFELYAALDDGAEPDLTLPPREEFLASCERYWSQRRTGTCIAGLTIAQLEADVERLTAERDTLIAHHVRPWPACGWAVRLPDKIGVAAGGELIDEDLWYFDSRDAAVAAYRRAAGLEVLRV